MRLKGVGAITHENYKGIPVRMLNVGNTVKLLKLDQMQALLKANGYQTQHLTRHSKRETDLQCKFAQHDDELGTQLTSSAIESDAIKWNNVAK